MNARHFGRVLASLLFGLTLLPPMAECTKLLLYKSTTQSSGATIQYQAIDPQAIGRLGGTVLAEYPFFYLLEVARGNLEPFLANAATRGVWTEVHPEFDEIRVNGYSFPSAGPPPVLPTRLSLTAYTGPVGMYLVQTIGPNRLEWERALQAAGAQVRYFPENTWLIRASPGQVGVLRNLAFVQHVSVYQPAHKLSASVLSATGAVPLVVQLDAGQNATNAVTLITQLTGEEPTLHQSGPDLNAQVVLDADGAIALAFLPEVVWIETLPKAELSDERQVLPLGGYVNTSGDQPTNPGQYQNWLYTSGFCTPTMTGNCFDYGNPSLQGNSYVVVYDSGSDINVCNAEGSNCQGQYLIQSSRHPDLAAREARFHCATNQPPPPTPTVNYCSETPSVFRYSDYCGHGTAVASVIAGDPQSGVGDIGRDGASYYLGSGVAPLAQIISFKTFGGTGGDCFQLFLWGPTDFQRWSTSLLNTYGTTGARFANHSWNTTNDPSYSASSRMFDFLVRDADGDADHYDRPSTLVVSAGNRQTDSQSTYVYAPGTAKNVLTVGAAESWRTTDVNPWASSGYPPAPPPYTCQNGDGNSIRNISKWSCRGFRGDQALIHRFKPDLVAPGTRVGAAFTRGLSAPTPTPPAAPCGPSPSTDPNQGYYDRHVGTSFGAPIVTGAAMLVDAWFRKTFGRSVIPSPAMIKAILVAHAVDLCGGTDTLVVPTPTPTPPPDACGGNVGHRPSLAQGWGRVSLQKLFASNNTGVWFYDEDHNPTAVRRFVPGSASWTVPLSYTTPNPEITIVMAYTDYPAAEQASTLGVNNLDLAVHDGSYNYYGNVFQSDGYTPRSLIGLGTGDTYNTVELVRIQPGTLVGGTLAVEVRPTAILAKAVPGLDGTSSNQDFALYVYFSR